MDCLNRIVILIIFTEKVVHQLPIRSSILQKSVMSAAFDHLFPNKLVIEAALPSFYTCMIDEVIFTTHNHG